MINSNFNKENVVMLAEVLWDKYGDTFRAKHILVAEYNGIRLTIDESKKDEFVMNVCKRYEYIMTTYMAPSVELLDRHKVAAIAIIEFILSDILEYDEPKDKPDEIFMPKYLLAAQTGWAFMQYWLNNLLEHRKVNKEIKQWHRPKLLSCPKNDYFCVFARNLYFTEQRIKDAKYPSGFNEMELAEKLFLLEHITLIHNNIDPLDLIEEEER